MRLNQRRDILVCGKVTRAEWFRTVCDEVGTAIASVTNPPGAKEFSINPTKQGNGVVPIKAAFVRCLRERFGWQMEVPLAISSSEADAGPIDAVRELRGAAGRFAVEWETGNISSSHRALNKIALGILKGQLIGGALVLPSRSLYRFLTDRIGNFAELEPYFPVWGSLKPSAECIISVFEIEHDAEDPSLPLIRKGKDGMAKKRASTRKARR